MWKTAELTFISNCLYENPLEEAELTVSFISEQGTVIKRPAFWNGQKQFAVRVALTEVGVWQYRTVCSDTENTGLHNQAGQLRCVPYQGQLPIYQKGFLTIQPGKKYFSYRDGTPFFYLGDTHWFLCHEKWDSANVEGIDSQFRYAVDHRVAQGYTVYQSEPLYVPNIPQIYDLRHGLREEDIQGFQQLDKKFAYIAEAGLVHAHAQLFFTYEIDDAAYTPSYLRQLARFWVARYGSYPVLWTTAQEIDPHCYGDVAPDKWYIVAETVAQWDAYHQPITAHGANNCLLTAENSVWKDKPYHTWFGLQPQDNALNDTFYMRQFYDLDKPAICYETGYEGLWSTQAQALGAGYKAYLNGMCGYGYGAQGVWNDDYAPDDWMRYGDYYRWFDALHFEGGKKLIYCRRFFESFEWWKLEPHFDDDSWSNFRQNEKKALASIGTHTFVAFLFDETLSSGVLRHLDSEQYVGYWYNIHSGTYSCAGEFRPVNREVQLPPKPSKADWVIVLTDDKEWFANRPLCITSAEEVTTIANPGETLQFYANHPVQKWWVSPPLATIEKGLLSPCGTNGTCTVYAEDERGRIAGKSVILLRQDCKNPLPAPHTITVCGDQEIQTLTPEHAKLQIMALFDPPSCFDQRIQWEITNTDGSPTDKVFMETAGSITAISDGEVCVTARSQAFPDVKGSAIFKVSGFGEPSLALHAAVTSSDYYEGYDRRCYPWRAVNGVTDNYSGWCSADACSSEHPVYLILDLKEEKQFCQIELYTTSLSCALQDYTIEAERNGHWETLCAMEHNSERKNVFRFDEPVSAQHLRVRCTKGDINGNARIDQINLLDVFR